MTVPYSTLERNIFSNPHCISVLAERARTYIVPIAIFSVMYNMSRFFELRTRDATASQNVTLQIGGENETETVGNGSVPSTVGPEWDGSGRILFQNETVIVWEKITRFYEVVRTELRADPE